MKHVKSVLVCGAGGFIGTHLVDRLVAEGCEVRGVDLKLPAFSETNAQEFVVGDLRDRDFFRSVVDRPFDEVYQLAADMGGAGYIFDGANDAEIMRSSAACNLNALDACLRAGALSVFFSSSACIYPLRNQLDATSPDCAEESAYPADPDSEYGWEKLFAERLYLSHNRNLGMRNRVARYHNVFGPLGTWTGGREKAPAAICRKVAEARDGDEIEIWGDGAQTRSFLFVDECVEGTIRLMRSGVEQPLNVGSEEMISIDGLVDLVSDIAGKRLSKRHVPGPTGVPGRNSDNRRIRAELGWSPSRPLREGLEATYRWIEAQVDRSRSASKQPAPPEHVPA